MQKRGITWKVMGVAVAALWLAAPGTGEAGVVARYSFTKDATDSVGGNNGTLMGNVTFSGDGQVLLDGTAGTYIDLPIGDLLAGLSNSTFEAWITWQNPAPYWQRIFDFGQDTTTYMFFTTKAERNKLRFAISSGGGGVEQMVNAVGQLPDGFENHVAVTIDADKGIIGLYLNGSPACLLFGTTLQPATLGSTAHNYLGKSQFNDPYFNGSYNEFRIYDRALSAAEIAANFAAGPDGTPP